MKHTPEPWESDEDSIYIRYPPEDGGSIIVDVVSEVDAKRIVACINAFGAIKEKLPELYADPSKLADRLAIRDHRRTKIIKRLEAENKVLREALEYASECRYFLKCEQCKIRIPEALAKAQTNDGGLE